MAHKVNPDFIRGTGRKLWNQEAAVDRNSKARRAWREQQRLRRIERELNRMLALRYSGAA
jgi:hypothetical protein